MKRPEVTKSEKLIHVQVQRRGQPVDLSVRYAVEARKDCAVYRIVSVAQLG